MIDIPWQGCQIFIGAIYTQNWEEMYPMTTKLQNGLKIFRISVKYTNIFHSKALKNITKLAYLV
jgi:hypothetical protein